MDVVTFYGGLRFKTELPDPGVPIEEILPPKNVILPLSDRTGLICRALVDRGERVSIGEKIGEDSKNRLTPVHSPISGKVTAIDSYRLAECGNTLSIFIESRNSEERDIDHFSVENLRHTKSIDLINVIRDAGVSIVPFEPTAETEGDVAEGISITKFVINGIGHGFFGSIARRLLVEKLAEFIKGVHLVKRIFKPEKIFLVINEKHEDVIHSIKNTNLEKDIEVVKLRVYYPLGHPYLLFKTLFNQEIPGPRGRALDTGTVFTSVDAIIDTSEAINQGKPLIERYISVLGPGIQIPKNLKARIGTPLKDIIDACGGFKGKPGRVVLGNPLNGMAQFSLDRPVLKDTHYLWVQPEEQVVKDRYRACINCGDCVDACPMQLMPNFLGRFCEFCKYEEAAGQYDLFTCIECGLCAYVCPSRRPLVHFIKLGKRELSNREKENVGG